jgi:hypothetical protein
MPRRRPVVRHSHVGAPHALTSLLEGRGLLEMALLAGIAAPADAGACVATATRCCWCRASWPTKSR